MIPLGGLAKTIWFWRWFNFGNNSKTGRGKKKVTRTKNLVKS